MINWIFSGRNWYSVVVKNVCDYCHWPRFVIYRIGLYSSGIYFRLLEVEHDFREHRIFVLVFKNCRSRGSQSFTIRDLL